MKIMTNLVTCCFDDQDCEEAARLMRNRGVRRLAVLDRKQAMVGVLSVDDLARCSHDLAGEVLEAVAPRVVIARPLVTRSASAATKVVPWSSPFQGQFTPSVS